MISSLKMLSSPHVHEKPQCVHERDYRVRRAAARPAQPLRDTPPRSVRDAASAVVAIRSGAGARVEAPRQRSASASERRMADLKPPEHIETVAPDPSKPPKR